MFGLSGRFATLRGSVAGGPGGPDGGPVGGPFGPGGAVGGPLGGPAGGRWRRPNSAAAVVVRGAPAAGGLSR